MQNPLVKKDLVDAILELRADVEKQLQANKYYVALNKLDELLAAIRPLEIVEASGGRNPEARGRGRSGGRAPRAIPAGPGPASSGIGDRGRRGQGALGRTRAIAQRFEV